MVQRVLRSITDLGPLTELLGRRDVEEIFVEGARVSRTSTPAGTSVASPTRPPRRRTARSSTGSSPRPNGS